MKKTFFILTGLLIAIAAYSQWSLTGNSGTSTSNFLGTTDNNPLILRVNNQLAGFTGGPNHNNVLFGYYSFPGTVSGPGEENTVFGSYSMVWNNQSSRNVVIGRYVMENSITGNENVAIGHSALGYNNYPGDGNVAVGGWALRYNNQNYNTAVGYHAAHHNTTGDGITAIGYRSLWRNTTGEFNTAIGHNSLLNNTTGYWNVALGSGSLYCNTTGHFNTAGGNSSLFFNTTGTCNTGFGQQALSGNMTGSYNTAVGCMALWSVSYDPITGDSGYGRGEGNTALGFEAIKQVTTGSWNVGIGIQTMHDNSTGSENATLGAHSLFNNKTGNKNVAIGTGSLSSNIGGSDNVAMGYRALSDNKANGNVAVGMEALKSNNYGEFNTAIGHKANVSAENFNNATAIGYNALATASDQVRIGNNSVTSIGGFASWSSISDERIKKNIQQDVPGLVFINKLQPVTYNMDLEETDKLLKTFMSPQEIESDLLMQQQTSVSPVDIETRMTKHHHLRTGFIAQAVEKAAQSIGYEFSGIDIDDRGIYALRYSEFVVPLVKAVQELSEQNEELKLAAQEVSEHKEELKQTTLEISEQNKDLKLAVQEIGEQNKDLKLAVQEISEQIKELKLENTVLQNRIDELEITSGATTIASLQEQVNTLADLINRLLEEGNIPSSMTAINTSISEASLEQNFPNPFNQVTNINYTLPQTFNSAKIVISDTSGRVYRQIGITGSGAGNAIVSAGSLSAGVYYYSLVVDNMLVDTKKMVLTK